MADRKKLLRSIVFMLVVLLLSTSLYIIKKRSSIYPYEVDQSYQYNFHGTSADIMDIALKNGKIKLDQLDDYQSAFLKVHISTTIIGKYFQPAVEIRADGQSYTQYFEHGAEGTRYINVSPLLSEDKREIELKGIYVSIDDQSAQLYLFRNQDIKKSRLLVLAPHPDDAEIAAFGLYSSNSDSYIVTVTAGDAGDQVYDEVYPDRTEHFMKKGELRTWNSITVPLLGGIPPEQALNLGFFDDTLEKMFTDNPATVSASYANTSDINTFRKQNVSSLSDGLHGVSNWNSLVTNIGYLLETIRPDIIVAPYPALDGHEDHIYTSIALFEAIKKSNRHDGYIYLYATHLKINNLYPYGKMGGVVSLPPNFSNDIYFSGIYSHSLTAEKQKDKIFALEAMNDLRPDTEWRFSGGAVKMALSNIKRDISGRDYSFFRRAVRNNELFFVVDIKDIYDESILNRMVGER